MAAEMVAGALVSTCVQMTIDRLADRFRDIFRGRKDNKKQLSNLKLKLLSIDVVADDAEQKQFRDRRVRDWLLKAKHVVFEAEDLLNEIDYELSKCEAEAKSQSAANKVWNSLKSSVCSFQNETESRMEQVLEELEDLASQIDLLRLKKDSGVGVGSGSGSKVSQKLPSTSLVVESNIYGRDDDTEKIINCLTSDTDNKLSILSIVGMGGLGKTTLAQLVYNDSRIESKFDIKAWVCVSEEFDVLNVSRAILNTITDSTDHSTELEVVQRRLKEKLTNKRFLLVLDDVWNESQIKWEAVQNALVCGAQGSMILVTTRSKEVAFAMRSKEHPLEELQGDYCWQLFAKHAFQDDDPQPNPVFKDIGMKIVKKCKGLPLALKTMGSLLHNKSSVPEWESVLQSEIWEFSEERSDIVPALALSYHHLPPHLKTCFAYCGLFPKDCEFDKECLIQLWMAENFLHCHQCSKSPEEIGEQYFNDLLSRSFFQQSSKDKEVFVMHDLLNDLAKYVCGDIYFRLEVDQAKSTQKTTRHFSVVVIDDKEYFDGFETSCDTKRLRTFMPTSRSMNYIHSWHCNMSIHELFSKFKFIRVLSLSHCSDIKEVPDSVCDLKHLRSLDLSKTDIEKLPDSTCSLSNLQILKLNSCRYLKELPLNLHELTSLRRLEIKNTELRKVPPYLGKLKNLQVLMSSFDVGKSSEFTIQQLGELNLHGSLSIGELQNIEDPSNALAVGLKNKRHLVKLELKWNGDRNPDDLEKERDENVIKNLQPSEHLEKLSICSYGGTKFPSWLSDNSLRNVVSLELYSCQSCLRLPCLGLLPFLKDLVIRRLHGIVNIDAEFHGSSSSSFTSLEKLEFGDMRGWEKWECQDVTGAFPRLHHLSIKNCPKLKGRLPVQLVQLNTLSIDGCEHLVDESLDMQEKRLTIWSPIMEAWLLEGIRHIISSTSLQHLRVDDCPNINIPMSGCYDSLDSLTIYNSFLPSLVTFPLDSFPTLGELDLRECPNLQRISQEHTHNRLRNLTIIECPELESLPERMQTLLPSLEKLEIEDCPKVESFPEGGLPSNLRSLSLHNCSKLIASADGESFPDEDLLPPSLTSLSIGDSPSLKCLPEGLCRLSCLQELDLLRCPSLECLPEGFCQLSSLNRLTLECPSLECLPGGLYHFSSLKQLSLGGCPNLECLLEGLCHLSSLEELCLYDYPSLKCLPEWLCHLSSVKKLVLKRCNSLECSPQDLCHLSSLKELVFEFCYSLKCLPEGLYHLSSLQKLVFEYCRSLECLPEGLCHLSSLKELSLRHCHSLECLPEGLCHLSSLKELSLRHCYSLKCLPEGLCHLSSLKELSLRHCYSLECLPEGLCHLSSLKELVFEYCYSLKCLPEKGLPKSISTLRIWSCPLLDQRCQEPDGEDWPKIALIQNRYIS